MNVTKSNSASDTLAGLDSQLHCFTVARDDRGVVSVSLDVPNRSMNVIDERVLDELTWIVNSLQTDATAKVVVFRSGKASGFLAGADVHEIAGLHDHELLAQTLRRGQDLFDRIEQISAVTVAAIDGPCMGGGLEWALACDHRVISDSPATRLGLPEIRLGLLPAWGGTQRLPQTVGLAAALPLILKGKAVDATRAIRIGLADRMVSAAHFSSKVAQVVAEVLDGKFPQRQRNRSWTTRIAERLAIGRRMILQQARHEIHKQDPEQHYPAALLVVDAIERGLTDRVDGLAAERQHFATLLESPTSRRLMGLFFQRERAKNLKTWAPLPSSDGSPKAADQPADTAEPLPEIRNLVVIGGGVMGAEIAQLAAAKDFHVTVQEIDAAAADAARKRIEGLVKQWAKYQHADEQMLTKIRQQLHVTCDDTALSKADLVIEAVVERESVKRQVFRDVERLIGDDTLLVSNTSSLRVQRMAEVTSHPDRVAGLHFFNPVSRMELVEVVHTHDTDPRVLQRLLQFARSLGKTPVVTADSPGFIVNRVLFPYLGEAVQMTIEGYDAEFIDRPMRSFGMPMGPLELLDHVGIDIAAHVADSLSGVLPDAQAVAERLKEMSEAGELGKKSGQGFYLYKDGKMDRPVVSGQSECFADKEVFCDDGLTPTQRRVLYPMINEAMRCLDEKIVRESWMVDLAVVLGTGFAPFRGGPLQWLDDAGADVVRQNMEILAEQFGSHFEPVPGLLAAAQWKEPLMRMHPSLETL
ncbi:3-hydroxyacyl-CoA dehydrogenase NAD-binding domain-containing protein [Roseimaritima ulvae]|uniref:enoyl-CoA hydratase n=1 Tax=Roseimaritima ulvae TaxID=980254 RepID=A0A5B9QVV6_9BACT|nr:3-hydroxyacyl-CoA dehydrogenase NAD-binding domain-containing protein [Roseimaritima ulvae]QEG41920.1 Fatty acid oxidation complex subunit alpha [Roseimaritima ulvae]